MISLEYLQYLYLYLFNQTPFELLWETSSKRIRLNIIIRLLKSTIKSQASKHIQKSLSNRSILLTYWGWKYEKLCGMWAYVRIHVHTCVCVCMCVQTHTHTPALTVHVTL